MFYYKVKSMFLDTNASDTEKKYQLKIMSFVLPLLSGVMGFLAFVVMPLRFGFTNTLLSHSNFIMSAGMFSVFLCVYLMSLKKTSTFYSFIVVGLFNIVGFMSLFIPQVLVETPYVPFYALTVGLVTSSLVLTYSQIKKYSISFVIIFLVVSLFSPFTLGEFLHRSGVILFTIPITFFMNYFRYQSFLGLEEKTEEILNSSNIQVLAELSGNIAHEINNPLMIISGQAQLLMSMSKMKGSISGEKAEKSLEKINDTAMRISNIISGLKRFSRTPDTETFEFACLKEVLDESINIYAFSLKQKNIQLHVNHHHNLEELKMLCMPVQISQVFINLISNAMDAVENLEKREIYIDFNMERDFVSIDVKDSGDGIPKEMVQTVLRPFFTTKAQGKGTGLGLSLCKKIVASHDGEFTVKEYGNKYFFNIILPIANSDLHSSDEKQAS